MFRRQIISSFDIFEVRYIRAREQKDPCSWLKIPLGVTASGHSVLFHLVDIELRIACNLDGLTRQEK